MLEFTQDGQIIVDEQEAILKRLLRLIQITSNPSILDESYQITSGKIPTLVKLIEEIFLKKRKGDCLDIF